MLSLHREQGHGNEMRERPRGGRGWVPTLAVLYLTYAPAIAVMAIVTTVHQRLTSWLHLLCAAAIAACIPVYLLLEVSRFRERRGPPAVDDALPPAGGCGDPSSKEPPEAPGPATPGSERR